MALSLLAALALAACPLHTPTDAGHLYCKRCGAPLLACDELEHVSSPMARVRPPRARNYAQPCLCVNIEMNVRHLTGLHRTQALRNTRIKGP
ncbi:hypothetical protein T492DRAFT_345504 [Pavlovales sp. CCMP2436]|nr:hypothetical protein T492DRAFT_345504 [Pavlovales sp. CCMP2436]